jgi:CheY-like chemotaxis protein
MCHSIVSKHGGHIGVESRLGEGSVFTIHLPAADPAECRARRLQPEVCSGVGRVLIMEDEASVAHVLSRMLGRIGYESETAIDGESAMAAYCRARENGVAFDAVIMDLTISGGMGGLETVRLLLGLDPNAKVIVSSGYSGDPVMAEYQKHGFRGVLAKPYRLGEVSEAVARVMTPSAFSI